MAKNFELTRNEIIRTAFENCRAAIDGEELSAENLQKGARALNTLLKFWQAQGFHLWKLPEAWLFTNIGQAKYMLGENGALASDHIIEAVLDADASKDDTTLSLDGDLPSVGDYICIVLDNGCFMDAKVLSVSSNIVTIDKALIYSASEGNKVWFFTALLSRPLKITQARRYIIGGSEIEMQYMENEEYFALPQKDQMGTPVSYTYVPTLEQGTLYLWNTPIDKNIIIKFTYEKEFDVLENSKDVPDVADEWVEPLIWELSYRLSAFLGLDLNEREWLKAQAKESLETAKCFDNEVGGFQIVPDFRG